MKNYIAAVVHIDYKNPFGVGDIHMYNFKEDEEKLRQEQERQEQERLEQEQKLH